MRSLSNHRDWLQPNGNTPDFGDTKEKVCNAVTDFGDLAERLELLKLRSSSDPTARAIALAASLLIRRLDAAVTEVAR